MQINKKEESRKIIFICTTYYHVLVAILKTWQRTCKADIILCDDMHEYKELQERLARVNIFTNVYTYEKIGSNPRRPLTFFKILFTGHKSNAAWVETSLRVNLRDYEEVYIFHDGTELGRYLMDIRKKYVLLEDAEDFFKIVNQTASVQLFEEKNLKYYIKYILNYGYFYFGQNRFCRYIEVNDSRGIMIPQKKIRVARKKELYNGLSIKQKELLLEIFLDDKVCVSGCGKQVLILTEPLYIDGYIRNENIQKTVYKELVDEELRKGYTVILKPHPRDDIQYEISGNVRVLKKEFPIEIIDFIIEEPFEKVIAISSTAVYGLRCVKEKVLLGKKVLEKHERNSSNV